MKLPLPFHSRGKVRDIYEVGRDKLLIVTTDRLSAFDVVLPDPIPYKGKVLTQISVFWFNFFSQVTSHHLITADVTQMGLSQEIVKEYGAALSGRSMLVRRTKPLSVECVVRGYLTGSGWKDYLATGSICGHVLPKGMKQCERLPQPIFTPATKESAGHDINIDLKQATQRIGADIVSKIEKRSIELYQKAAAYASEHGILIADTKFEFGLLDGELILIDEVLTPDSSRFWPKDRYEVGHDQPSFDKQIVRNYLLGIQWNQKPPAPNLPREIIEKTSQAYRDAYRRLAGKEID
ncbi:MAG: phosphoribosylaminoimidazolesuccinocarboxamide synthase [Candidatus Omnitrophica bacterium]|nr:phosphoribosylaminoimidazolesuccinocarboxamide synthase [Candidatus Omnitrophota bacterium]